ncbi:hypothetical protein Emtol_1052 [Emticicia oligotrophica DSM 17448]|uniref:Uncharacterized protein n=2 Tax=Emticicia TaxID=312278 RepID=A0ABN4AJP9_EMTOG|nr:hypothetical protein Emtol_1052 [Emticicia oligotrophica DSM 17448]
MNKSEFYQRNMKRLLRFTFIGLLCVSTKLIAQMPHDAIYMPKRTACIAVSYNRSTWNEYWENTLKRENLNIGTLTTQSVMPMVAVGLTDKLNLIVGVPYVKTEASAGNLMGQKGIQDLSGWLKYKLADNGKGLSIHGTLGASAPVTNYVPDFLPMSIGLRAKTATGRFIGNYLHKSGIYVAAHASYMFRSNIKVDRDAYQADNRVYNTNEVSVPNATDAAARLGYMKDGSRIQAEAFVEHFTCVGGDNIRRNDMPFPTNNMTSTTVGFYGKYQPKNIGLNVRVAKVLSGLNVGQTTSISVGLLYQLNYFKQTIK